MNKQFMLRIYDSNALKKIDELYKKQQKNFKSFNEFLSLTVLKGVDKINSELGLNKEKDLQELTSELKDLKEQLNSFKQSIVRTLNNQTIDNDVFKAMLGCMYEIIFALNNGTSLNTIRIESGIYDFLPNRYSELLKEYRNDNK